MSVSTAAERIRAKLAKRVAARAEQGNLINTRLHMTSPRGGPSINYYRQQRSAPGEAPAVEFGVLLSQISEVKIEGLRASWVTNYAVLEFGYDVGARSRLSDSKTLGARRMAPRPMGRMTIEELKQAAKS